MKISLLSKADSVHTTKWVNFLESNGHEVSVLSLHKFKNKKENFYYLNPPQLPFKLGYFFVLPKLKKILKKINPDILHAHYASSYGLLGALSNFHPLIVSVWGSDVFEFPEKSPLHLTLLKFVLNRADVVTSTSNVMGERANEISLNKKIEIVPFGIDTDLFTPQIKEKQELTIGTVRALETKYGIDYLIKAFALVSNNFPDVSLSIAGEGSKLEELKKLVHNLNIENKVTFLGQLPQNKVASFLRTLDIFVIPSVAPEAFGVASLEASSTGLPVIGSRIGGLVETIEEGKTGLFAVAANEKDLADKLTLLLNDSNLRKSLGKTGREFVLKNFQWDKGPSKILGIYNKLLNR